MWKASACVKNDVEGVRMCKEKLQGFLPAEAADGLEMIIRCVEQEKEADFRMKFDPTLVRGMSYYTGTIFEISMDEFGGSVGGGGRYDEMIGKFTGQDTPAVGFSIGFERIVMLLLERGYQVPRPGEEGIPPGEEDLPGEAAGSAHSGESRACGRQTGDDHEYEEEQEVPEGTACRTGIYRDYGGVQWLNQCRD